jgi:hypothetical protein
MVRGVYSVDRESILSGNLRAVPQVEVEGRGLHQRLSFSHDRVLRLRIDLYEFAASLRMLA